MRIGIDIDETIAASFYGLFEHCKKIKNVEADWEDFTEFDICRLPAFQMTREEETALWREFFAKNYQAIKKIDGSFEALSLLKELWHTFTAITGRHKESDATYTEIWINEHFPNFFDGIHYVNHGGKNASSKAVVCKNLDIPLMVDDSFDFALDLAENGVTAIVLEKPWNKHRTETHPNIIRVKDWSEIPNHILAYTKNK